MRIPFPSAPIAALLLLGASVPLAADPVGDLVGALPESLLGLTRLAGPDGSDTGFVVAREAARDRLFILRGGAVVEVGEAGETGGRITSLRSEKDAHGVLAFVDIAGADGAETTYELFLEGENAAGYVFQQASN
ncbi:hypothetical protein [Stappia sp.]|uniref:hypothetical protein n=1 Tax=Stappia sp. TaxID=1870903 RepID=UPI003D09D296